MLGGWGDAATDLGVELVEVSHPRELRGAWIATVSNIDWPSRAGLAEAAAKTELLAYLDAARAVNLNAVFFQVRPEADTFYRSNLEPWSRYLTGTQGQDPGWDPLQFLLDEAHARGLEVHAWLNPYRAKASFASAAAPNHVSVTLAEHAERYGNLLWMDPGALPVQVHLLAVVDELVRGYALDGLHFDDYFYPYPDSAVGAFPDDASFAVYQQGGGNLSRDDWRRDNVNQMVRGVSETVAAADPACRFGISPFGIYRPGIPPGISGLDQYAAIYADPPVWISEGWVDYLAPQLYWRTDQTRQAYGVLIEWWAGLAAEGRSIFAGNYLSQLGMSGWTLEEFEQQLALTRAQRAQGALGNIYFTLKPLQRNTMGVADLFRETLYPRPALPPPLATATGSVAPPEVVVSAGGVRASHPNARFFVVYRAEGSSFEVQSVLDARVADIALPPGRYALSAADRRGLESAGVVLEVP